MSDVVETIHYAKLGHTTYQATGDRWDGDDIRSVVSGEYKTLPAAKLVARSWLRRGATQFTIWRGTYEDFTHHDDPDYGTIYDADWSQDEHWVVNGWPDGNGGIEWEEESW